MKICKNFRVNLLVTLYLKEITTNFSRPSFVVAFVVIVVVGGGGGLWVSVGVYSRLGWPYMGFIGMCRCERYGFQAVYSGIGYINQRI